MSSIEYFWGTGVFFEMNGVLKCPWPGCRGVKTLIYFKVIKNSNLKFMKDFVEA